jgi:hypothetical protein
MTWRRAEAPSPQLQSAIVYSASSTHSSSWSGPKLRLRLDPQKEQLRLVDGAQLHLLRIFSPLESLCEPLLGFINPVECALQAGNGV